MTKIEAIVRPEKLDPVRLALEKVGCAGVTITEVEGHGNQKGIIQQWRGEKYKVELLPKVKIEIVVKDDEVEKLVKTIADNARTGPTGAIGDGKIFVYGVQNAIRIRTGDGGEKGL